MYARVVGIHLQECFDSAHANTHGREAVCLSDLPQFLLAVRSSPVAQEDAHRRATLPVHGLRQVVPAARRPPPPSEACPPRQLAGHDTEEASSAADHRAGGHRRRLSRAVGDDP